MTQRHHRGRLVGGVVVVMLAAGCASSTTSSGTRTSDSSAPAPAPVSAAIPARSSQSVSAAPPFIDHVEWVSTPDGPSLQIYPTPSGRRTQDLDGDARAWREVLAMVAAADSPGMRAQFDCHWTFARVVEPDKPSWNLEPWRPVVSPRQMVADRCNPGGPEI